MRRICVYCGSNTGSTPVYAEAAEALAATLCANDLELVYGGAGVGIMGILADAVLAGGGRVHGVIPKFLQAKEIAHAGLTELHVVRSMHERKSLMADLADAFVALPGGFGTLEELIEMLTWGQLRVHAKPCGVLNVDGYFDALLAFFDHAAEQGFLRAAHRRMLLSADKPAALLAKIRAYEAPALDKWTGRAPRRSPQSENR